MSIFEVQSFSQSMGKRIINKLASMKLLPIESLANNRAQQRKSKLELEHQATEDL